MTLRYVAEAVGLATLLTAVLIAATLLTETGTVNPLETGSVWFSFASTWLCTRQSRWYVAFALGGTTLLVVTFAQAGLYGSMALNLYLIPTVVYAWFIWGRDDASRPVAHVTVRAAGWYLLAALLTWAGAYALLTALGGTMAPLDGGLLVGTVLAQYLMDRKKIENWFVWVLVNLVSCVVYASAGLLLLAGQFLLFLATSVVGYTSWRASMRSETARAPAVSG